MNVLRVKIDISNNKSMINVIKEFNSKKPQKKTLQKTLKFFTFLFCFVHPHYLPVKMASFNAVSFSDKTYWDISLALSIDSCKQFLSCVLLSTYKHRFMLHIKEDSIFLRQTELLLIYYFSFTN